jgi:hypothetical protein
VAGDSYRRIVTTLFVIRVLVSIGLGAAFAWWVTNENFGAAWDGGFGIWWAIGSLVVYFALGRWRRNTW